MKGSEIIQYLTNTNSFLEIYSDTDGKMINKREIRYPIDIDGITVNAYTFVNLTDNYDYNTEFLLYIQTEGSKTANIYKIYIERMYGNFIEDFIGTFKDLPQIIREQL